MRKVPKSERRKLRALGVTSGIGSMLVGPRDLGYEIVGNIEWRKYYHHKDEKGRNTFQHNFPGSFLVHRPKDLSDEQMAELKDIDYVAGHPECGNFSNLVFSAMNRKTKKEDPMDIPVFIEILQKVQPKVFLMDNLPPSLEAVPLAHYKKELPDYDLYPEWVDNSAYGNAQQSRRRFFLIGSRKDVGFQYIPKEDPGKRLCANDVLIPLERKKNLDNNYPQDLDALVGKCRGMVEEGKKPTWREMREYVLDKVGVEGRYQLEYWSKNQNMMKGHIGMIKGDPRKGAAVLTGGVSGWINPRTCVPYTLREASSIQGFPLDFEFFGCKLDEKGQWNFHKNIHMVKQIGKAMPIPFCKEVARQVQNFLWDGHVSPEGYNRALKPNVIVDAAKIKFCSEIGYSNQENACRFCWVKCPVRKVEQHPTK